MNITIPPNDICYTFVFNHWIMFLFGAIVGFIICNILMTIWNNE